MQQPQTVAGCVAALRAAVRVPVTVKMRIGVIAGRGSAAVDASRHFGAAERAQLYGFVGALRDAGCDAVIVHARKAVLGGLSAQENRSIPPLQYDVVRQVKRAFPDLPVVLNGGLRDPAQMGSALAGVDGIMLGREAYHRPMVLAHIDARLFGAEARRGDSAAQRAALDVQLRARAIERMQRYAERQLSRGERLSAIIRHVQGLYAGEPGADAFRRALSAGARHPGAGAEVLSHAAASAEATHLSGWPGCGAVQPAAVLEHSNP
jgi:tRNA-dihydrouridine synthase A